MAMRADPLPRMASRAALGNGCKCISKSQLLCPLLCVGLS